ncbi:CGNR zinc finger domain-containing protein [Streptomyces sp. NPDC048484]|uniref:CGNR zinc finger domain-containing protein n=1 Tax=Streptomyces sp. NPDC048484 TaxID=3155146 RepID=UPI0034364E66
MSERTPAPGGLVLIQSLVNTLDIETGADALDTADGRARFGLGGDEGEGEVESARELRESLRVVCLAHAGHPAHREVRPLDELLASAPLVVTVAAADGSAAFRPADPAPLAPLASRVAAAVAESLTAGTWLRLKACEAPDCHWAYYDRSPAGRGRWCSMSGCGARAKMRRYRAK